MELTFNFELDDFQKEAKNYIENGRSVVVCAPTGAGKTVIAEIAIHKALEENKRVFYTTPLKALSNQKFHDFQKKYGEDKVGLLTGDISNNRNAQIVVMTTEVFRNMLYGTSLGKLEDNLNQVRYVILDEVHYMNDEQRGTVWEESIIYCPPSINIIALSATVRNAEQLTEWINTVHNETMLVDTDFRPVPLRFYYFSEDNTQDILPLFNQDGFLNKKIRPLPKGNRFRRNKRKTSPADLVAVLHKRDMLPAIYFTFSRKKCDSYMEECARLNLLTKEEEKKINEITKEFIKDNPYLANHKFLNYLYSGVASHHAGLLPCWKNLIEKLFQQGLIKVVFATETLAAGINMPARTTIISSISKRTDSGHRNLTASEFLQMSGRAGRRGMDKIGHVVIVGTQFNEPIEIFELATSKADPLESRFAPGYSMVLNLLQRFTLEQARELILKSFGYYFSTTRLKPHQDELNYVEEKIKSIDNYKCPYKLTTADMYEFNKIKNIYVQHKKLTNTLLKQAKNRGGKNAPEVVEYSNKTKELYHKMESIKCNYCKLYKKHIREAELKDRYEKKRNKILKTIELERDIYWNRFISLCKILEKFGYLEDNFPTDKGITTAQIRAENELFISELLFNGVFDGLNHKELASLVCAVTTEEDRGQFFHKFKLSAKVRDGINKTREIIKNISRVQKDNNIENYMHLNPQYSSFIEFWIEGGEWEDMFAGVDVSEGDVVRAFRRTIDILRQLTVIKNVPEEVVQNAKLAIDLINRDPINDDM